MQYLSISKAGQDHGFIALLEESKNSQTWPWLHSRSLVLYILSSVVGAWFLMRHSALEAWPWLHRVYASCYRTVQLYSCQTVLMDPGSQFCTTWYLAVHLEHDPGYITPCMLPLPYHGSVPRCPKEGLPSFLLSLISASCLWHQLPYWGKDLLGFILKVFGPLSINVDST